MIDHAEEFRHTRAQCLHKICSTIIWMFISTCIIWFTMCKDLIYAVSHVIKPLEIIIPQIVKGGKRSFAVVVLRKEIGKRQILS